MAKTRKASIRNYDWLTIILYLAVAASGLALLYTIDGAHGNKTSYFSKQMLWFGLSLLGFIVIYSVELKKIKEWSSLIYLAGLLLLAGLFVFGTEVSGAKAWYRFGGIGFQPAEFMKLAVALGLAKLLSERGFDIKNKTDLLKALLLITVPVVLILLQPDLGSVLIFGAFIIVLYREGVSGFYLFPVFWLVFLFILSFKLTSFIVQWWLIGTFVLSSLLIYFKIKKDRWYYIGILFVFFSLSVGFVRLSDYVYARVLKPHQQKRIALLLGEIKDDRGVGYHLKQSLIAISNGGLKGQGVMQGVQLRGNYIPEQHTDYIFTALAEQTGFTGSVIFLLLYIFLIVRIYLLAERQKQTFSRVVGYSLASLLAVHLFINILMVIGLFPIVGIPIIFVSYGGTSFLIFSLFLFLFLKMDANRVEEL